jgi:hypothetical protein
MEKDNTVKTLVTTFIVLLLALAFVISIADQTNNVTSKTNAVDEAYNLSGIGCYTAAGQVNGTGDADCAIAVSYAPTSWKIEDCPLTNVVVTNTTGTVLVLDTDYELSASTGIITMLNTTDTVVAKMGNNVLFDYSYCADNYVNSTWGRQILGVNVGLFAIAILIVVLLAVYFLLGKNREDD